MLAMRDAPISAADIAFETADEPDDADRWPAIVALPIIALLSAGAWLVVWKAGQFVCGLIG
jgi:hypothetical protein